MSNFDELWDSTGTATATAAAPTGKQSFDDLWDTVPVAPKPAAPPAPAPAAPQPSFLDKAKQFGSDVVQGAQYLATQPPATPVAPALAPSPKPPQGPPQPIVAAPVTAPASTTAQMPLPRAPAPPVQPAVPLGQPGSIGPTGEAEEAALTPAPGSVDGLPPSEQGTAPASTTSVTTPPPKEAEAIMPGAFAPSKVDLQAKGSKAKGSEVPAVLAKTAARQFEEAGELLAKPAKAVAEAWTWGTGTAEQAMERTAAVDDAYENFFEPARKAYKLTPDQEQTIKDMGLKGDALVAATAFAAQLPMWIGVPGGAGKLVIALRTKFGESVVTEGLGALVKIAGGNATKEGKEIEDAISAVPKTAAKGVEDEEPPTPKPTTELPVPPGAAAAPTAAKLPVDIPKFNVPRAPEEITNRKALLDADIAGHPDPAARERLKARSYDKLLGEYGVTSPEDFNMSLKQLEEKKIPYTYEFFDVGNLGGANEEKGHQAVDAAMKKLYGEIYTKEATERGAIVGRGAKADEFTAAWPNYTKDQVEQIRSKIEENIRIARDKLGYGNVKNTKLNHIETGALHTDYGLTESKPGMYGDMYRAAEDEANQKKLNYYLAKAGQKPYNTVEAQNVDRNVSSKTQSPAGNEPAGPDVVASPEPGSSAGNAEKSPPVGAEVPPQEPKPHEAGGEPQAPPSQPAEVKPPEAERKVEEPTAKAAPEPVTEKKPILANQPGGVPAGEIKDYLDKSREQIKYSGDLEKDYYKLLGANESDKIGIRDILKKNDISLKDQEAIYHHIENPEEPITPEQEKAYHETIKPIMDEANSIYSRLRNNGYPVPKEGHLTRNAQDRGGWMDRLVAGAKDIISSGPLRKTTASMKHRVMLSATDEEGNRKVISLKNGMVNSWENGKPTDLGKVNFQTKEELLDKKLEPLEKQQKRLEMEQAILNKRKGADVRKENIKNNLEDIQNQIDDVYASYDPNEMNDKVFTDAYGKKWKIGQATTKEIEENSNVKYHKTLLLNELVNLQKLRMADRATQYLEDLKTNPEFEKMAIKVGSQNLPEGYKPTNLPQLKGYAFPDRVSETLDTFYKNADKGLMSPDNFYSKVNGVLRNAIFFNPFMHVPNIAVHAVVNRGISPIAIPSRYVDLIKSSRRAIEATLTMNKDYKDALEKGAGLLYSKQVNKDLYKLMLEKASQELKDKPVLAGAIGKALGYANPAKLVKAIYTFSGRTTWAFNDIATLQAMYEEMGHGKPMEEAIADVAKHIPNYRIPARVLNSTTISKLMKSENGVTMFGAYHYGALKSYGEMAKSLLGKVPMKERAEAADKLAMMALIGFFVYPQLDNLAKMATGKPTSKFRRAGAITFPYKTQQLATGKIEFSDWLQSVMTPSVGLQLGTELLSGHDWRSGAKLPVEEAALRSVSPLGYGEKLEKGQVSPKDYALSLIGVSSPKFDLDKATPAEVKAYKLAMSHIPQKERSKQQIETSNEKRKVFDEYTKTKSANVLNQAVKAGTITKTDRTNALKGATETPLQKYSSRLSYDEIKSIIDDRRTKPEEKEELRNMPTFYIKDKIKQLASMEPGDKEREKVVEDIRRNMLARAQKIREMPQGEEKAAAAKGLKSMETMFKKGMRGISESERSEPNTPSKKSFSIRGANETSNED